MQRKTLQQPKQQQQQPQSPQQQKPPQPVQQPIQQLQQKPTIKRKDSFDEFIVNRLGSKTSPLTSVEENNSLSIFFFFPILSLLLQ